MADLHETLAALRKTHDDGWTLHYSDTARLLSAVQNVLELHVKQIDTPVIFGANFCHHCGYDYPCPTVVDLQDAIGGE